MTPRATRRTPVACPDCKTIHRTPDGTRCPDCRRAKARRRATPEERGYDRAHRRERARYLALQRRGVTLRCARCSEPIKPDEPFDLGHTDDRTRWTGPEHVDCNRRAAGRIGATITNG